MCEEVEMSGLIHCGSTHSFLFLRTRETNGGIWFDKEGDICVMKDSSPWSPLAM